MADWSTLPEELLHMIAVRLFSIVEHKRFRSICSSWRSSVPRAAINNPVSGILSFLSTKENINVFGFYICFTFSRATFFRVTPSSSSSQGWLIKSDANINFGKFRLLDPFSRFELPHSCESLNLLEFTVSNIGESYGLRGSFQGQVRTTPQFKRMVLVNEKRGYPQLLGISYDGNIKKWNEAREEWSRVNEIDNEFSDIIVHKGFTYALDSSGLVWWISSDLKMYWHGPLFDRTITNGCWFDKKFVECCGELYLVERLLDKSFRKRIADPWNEYAKIQKTVGFKVFKIDKEIEMWKEIKSLGDYAFVIATDTCFSVLAHEYYGCLKNTIYFTDNADKEIKMFKLDNGNGSIVTMSECSEGSFQMFVPGFL